ncbi:hypothetical protein [Sulfuriferula nivalis]|uniref:FAD/FMN-containing dehydrogenase n=1 Tax=Sulfuriferula nivalis TaxID=2675298 RepID=A0A809RSJ2_9PROT|nr:hypothetical protein [Sulfuriferula nivalis]BBP01851.1 hypothetical protein SFSGTM_25590 [Sulfuriferula nivalis]
MKISSLFISLFAGLTLNVAAAADLLKTGDELPKLTLTDQFDKAGAIPTATKLIVFMADPTAGRMIVSYIDSKSSAWLAQKHAVILSDIHKMPAMMKLFAFPELRSKFYSIILGREEADLAMFPHQKSCATVLATQANTITTIQYACSEKELSVQMEAH